MKYLLTGGAGFIGSHLNDYLLARGDEVIIIDNFSSGSMSNILRPLIPDKGPHIIADTVLNSAILDDIIPVVDYVFHLAAVVGVKNVLDSSIKTIETNVEGTSNVLKMAAKHKKPVMIFSTSEVYGKSNDGSFSENSDLSMGSIYKDRWSYSASKILDEYLAMAYYKEKALPVTIIRLFNVVGPRQTGRYGMVLPRFVKQALLGQPITVYGDGSQIRTFTHVDDAIETIHRLALNLNSIGLVFNVGSNQVISIKALAEMVKKILQSKSVIKYIPYDKAYERGFEDTARRVPDLSYTLDLTGYTPRRTITGMIEDVAKNMNGKELCA